MKWLKTGRQLGQAVKNVHRLRFIVGVFVKHGFADVVDRMDLGKYIPGRLGTYVESQADKTVPERLRLAFEELGPTFVKFGQLLSTRSDLLPENYLEEFKLLQDQVQPLPFEAVRAVIEKELNRKIGEAYSYFNEHPLAAASIAQVHEAKLHTGEEVVVKVQRPEIRKSIETDISLLTFLAGLLEKYIPESRIIGPRVIVDEFFRTLTYELDFRIEANNMAKIAENMASIPEIVIPKTYRSLTTEKVLTLEKLEGIRVTDTKALDAAHIDRSKIVQVGAEAFFKSVLIDGIFHGDLHSGNLFVLKGNRLGIVDFGIVGRLSQKARDQLASMVMSLVTEDYEKLCYEYAELGSAEASVDFEAFQREVRNTLSPYMGMPLAELNIGKILIEATKIATRYHIKVPGDWMIVFKAILTMEGMGRSLDPDFDLLAIGQVLVKDLVKDQYSLQRLSKEMLWVGRDVAALLKVLPRQIRWMFKKFNSNDFAFEIKSPDFEQIRKQLDTNGRRVSFSIIIAGLFISSSIALQQGNHGDAAQNLQNVVRSVAGYPFFSVVFFSIASMLFAVFIIKSFKK